MSITSCIISDRLGSIGLFSASIEFVFVIFSLLMLKYNHDELFVLIFSLYKFRFTNMCPYERNPLSLNQCTCYIIN